MLKKRLFIYLPFLLFVILFAVGTLKDLELARSIGVWHGWLLQGVVSLLPLVGSCTLAYYAGLALGAKIRLKSAGLRFVFVIVAVVSLAVAVYFGQNEMSSEGGIDLGGSGKIIGIAVSLILCLLFGWRGMVRGRANTDPNLWIILLFVLGLTAAVIFVTVAAKLFIHRPRFLYLVNGRTGLTLDDFCKWYQSSPMYGLIDGPDGMFKSFPSGHIALTVVLCVQWPVLCSLQMPGRRGAAKRRRFFCVKNIPAVSLLSLAVTLVTGFVRMVCGAHFLSDVAFPAMFFYALFIIAYEVYLKKFDRAEPLVCAKDQIRPI